ncbi:uncharacterized protein LOC131252733 isoform X2 [Magnolia sinica]|uniref:uncharacterized protein LOC131252733 isoform X2 n=1 Tax=Magnolia sinica TaxID=86752 RepID=UPI00265A1573|nr:uncharacterized protein LOC131252733 isoform X2 [Magnolia sinica]
MEGGGRKPSSVSSSSSSSSSLSTELFGPKESPSSTLFPAPNTGNSSSTGIFNSVFPPASGGLGWDSSRSESFGSWRKENPEVPAWNGKHASAGGSRSSASENQSIPNKDGRSVFVDETVEPCFLSSSLYYGGRDMYSHSPSTRTSGTPSIFKKDGEEGEGSPPGASRGNWWQGSLYY